jgi:cobyrinic acid a,c-diamide synthase
VDLARVRALAAPASVPATLPPMPRARDSRLRIGIARDRAFGFYYADDLEALRAGGAELVFIDTLHDQRLPALDGLFIGGGFPETCADALEDNLALRGALREAIEGGLPTYAECGGLMLLARSIRWRDQVTEMVGVIPGDAVMHERPVGRGYVQLAETDAMPWPVSASADACAGAGGDAGVGATAHAPAPTTVRGHEFHYASLEGLPPGQRFAWQVQRGHGIDGRHDGLVVHNLLASFSHLRHGAGVQWVDRFLAYVDEVRAQRGGLPAEGPGSAPASPVLPEAHRRRDFARASVA